MPHAPDAIEKELHRVALVRRLADLRQSERPELDHALAVDPQPLARRDEEARLVRALEPCADRGGRVHRHLLEVVEDEQEGTARCDRVADALDGRAGRVATVDRNVQHVADRGRDPFDVVRVAEVREPRAPAPCGLAARPREVPCETRLADAGRARERDESLAVVESFDDGAQIRFDEAVAKLEHGIALCKFWLHLDPDEQLRRFAAREETAYKKYKITAEDYRNRRRWEEYVEAADEMVARTDGEHAPWTLVSANDKRWARVRVLEVVCEALERRL